MVDGSVGAGVFTGDVLVLGDGVPPGVMGVESIALATDAPLSASAPAMIVAASAGMILFMGGALLGVPRMGASGVRVSGRANLLGREVGEENTVQRGVALLVGQSDILNSFRPSPLGDEPDHGQDDHDDAEHGHPDEEEGTVAGQGYGSKIVFDH